VRVPLLQGLYWESKALAGLAEDGRIDTGGGLTAHLTTDVSIDLGQNWYIKARVGRVSALDGELEADIFDIGVGWQAEMLVATGRGIRRFDPANYSLVHWGSSLAHKTYFPVSSARNNQGYPYAEAQQLIGLELSKPLNSWLRARGSTHWAYAGDIGSYAEGLLGVSLEPEFLRVGALHAKLGYDFGVGGGGDMELGDGLVQQLAAGVEYKLGRAMSVELRAGTMRSLGGAYSADVLQLQFNWNHASIISRW